MVPLFNNPNLKKYFSQIGKPPGPSHRFMTQQQEFVIGGYTPPEGSRMYFGSLLVGYYDLGSLQFAGRLGTGFSERVLAELYSGLQKIRRINPTHSVGICRGRTHRL
jgi:ATP-dependent DNA ligase